MRRLFLFAALAALLAPVANAEFGNYVEHEVLGQTLVVRTDIGELRITALDDAAVEVHYVEEGVTQLPST